MPFIIPHFGAGLFREALARRRPVPQHLPRYVELQQMAGLPPGPDAGGRVPAEPRGLGPDRLLFGTDSSFFPRGWNRAVYEAQVSALDRAGVDEEARERILGGEFRPTVSPPPRC